MSDHLIVSCMCKLKKSKLCIHSMSRNKGQIVWVSNIGPKKCSTCMQGFWKPRFGWSWCSWWWFLCNWHDWVVTLHKWFFNGIIITSFIKTEGDKILLPISTRTHGENDFHCQLGKKPMVEMILIVGSNPTTKNSLKLTMGNQKPSHPN